MHRILDNQRIRLVIVSILVVFFTILFPLVYREVGDRAAALATVLVTVAGLLMGVRTGLVVWAFSFLIITIVVWLMGENTIVMAQRNWFGLMVTSILVMASGWFKHIVSDLWHEHQQLVAVNEERLKKINDCFLSFDPEPEKNIDCLTALARELLGAPLAMYNRYEKEAFTTVGLAHEADLGVFEHPYDCHICHHVVDQKSDDVVLITELQGSEHGATEPHVHALGLHTFVGRAVRIDQDPIGTLCILFREKVTIGQAQKEILGILASAIAVEEKRLMTERTTHESEQSYIDLFNTVTEAIFIVGTDHTFLNLNSGAQKMYGYTRDELLGKTPAIISAEDKNDMKYLARVGETVFRGNEPADFEYWGKRKDGELFPASVACTKGKYFGQDVIIATVRDLTEQKRMQEQLFQAQKLESLGTLTRGIAHDFNNLLAMIMASGEMLQRKLPEETNLMKYADRIVESSKRGTSISRQLLVFSRPEPADFQQIELVKIIDELDTMLGHFLPKLVSINTLFTSGNVGIIGDSGLVYQALLNLAINAGEAMKNSGTLTIRTFKAEPEMMAKKFSYHGAGRFIGISISDTGVGMTDETIAKIFDPYFSTKERTKGTGLGLAIVHGIVKQHKGFIDVESVLGFGSTFTLYFPAVFGAIAPDPYESKPVDEGRQETVLLVDDELMLRETIMEFLREAGYRVHVASNGIEGLYQYRQYRESIDLIITDLGMPEMGGEEFYRELRAIDPKVKVVVISGYLDGTTNEALIKLGVKKVLSKPCKMQEIALAVRSVLNIERVKAAEK